MVHIWTDYEPIHDEDGLHQVEESRNIQYNWDVNGNLEQRGSDLFSHDWRDRLVGVDQGTTTTTLIIDPLGRMVAKVGSTTAGDVRRVYLHDGDQVVTEYVQEAGGTAWQLDRRHHWGRWIDDLAVEQVDTDADGALDTTLYPITDLLGSVQLLTDATGEIVERIEYQTDGTPRFYAGDATPPTATRVAWTGDGQRPTGDTVAADTLEIGFDEWLDEASVEAATATLTPDGGVAVDLTVTLDDDGRGATLTGATIEAGTSYTLHIEGLTDRTGNGMWAKDLTFSVSDVGVYETLDDTTPPSVLAVLDAADGVYVLLDEPVNPIAGVDIADVITVERNGAIVVGSAERLGAQLLKWTVSAGEPWIPEQVYEITEILVEDLGAAPNAVGVLPAGFTHVAMGADQVLVAYSGSDHSSPLARSQYGVTSLFQGRGWHEELGVYYYRARWYAPGAGSFLERDPVQFGTSPSLYGFLNESSPNFIDPEGKSAFDPNQRSDSQVGGGSKSWKERIKEWWRKQLIYETPQDEWASDYTGETLEQSHSFLDDQDLNVSGRELPWYRDHSRIKLNTAYMAADDEQITRLEEAIVGARREAGLFLPGHDVGNPFGSSRVRRLGFGVPNKNLDVEVNRNLQRMRLFQLQRIMDYLNDESPWVFDSSNEEFFKVYTRKHRKASNDLLFNVEAFELPKGGMSSYLTYIVSAIYVNTDSPVRVGEVFRLERYLHKHFGLTTKLREGGRDADWPPLKATIPQ